MTLRRALPLALLLVGMQFWPALIAGTVVLSTNTLERAASATTIAVNALDLKTHIAHVKAVVRKIARVKKAKKT
jgi:hypothetical protein